MVTAEGVRKLINSRLPEGEQIMVQPVSQLGPGVSGPLDEPQGEQLAQLMQVMQLERRSGSSSSTISRQCGKSRIRWLCLGGMKNNMDSVIPIFRRRVRYVCTIDGDQNHESFRGLGKYDWAAADDGVCVPGPCSVVSDGEWGRDCGFEGLIRRQGVDCVRRRRGVGGRGK